MAREVAQGELGERLIAREIAGVHDPLVEQGEGWLLALRGAEDDHAVVPELPEEVIPALAVRGHPRGLEGGQQRIAAHDRAPSQEVLGDPAGGGGLLVGDAQVGAALGGGVAKARGGEPQHPAEVLRRHEVQRAAHRPGARDPAGGDGRFDGLVGRRRHAQADRPLRTGIVLRLHREQVPHGVLGLGEGGLRDALGGEPQGRHLAAFGG
jgi:hypothetical protein